MKLKSTDFNDYFFLPDTCGHGLGDKVPNLYVEGVPEGTTNLALTVYDSDIVYYDRELTYWLAWDLPADIGDFSNEVLPAGAMQGTNDMGTVGYYGPSLEREVHHIHFLIFALNFELGLSASSQRKEFDQAVNGRSLDHASLIGIFKPQQ